MSEYSERPLPPDPDDDKPHREALRVMETWQWLRADPDGVPFSPDKELAVVVSKLAMAGQADPKADILALLCEGLLIASGSFIWKKYQKWQYYGLEGHHETITTRQWKVLRELIAQTEEGYVGDAWPSMVTDLEELGYTNTEIWEWKPEKNCFRTALVSGNHASRGPDYKEEFLSFWDVSVCPISVIAMTGDDANVDSVPKLDPPADKGGRPPAANWELAVLELSGRYYKGDFKPATKADVQRELAAYLAETDIHPSPSTLASHAKPIFEAFQAWERD